MPEYFAFDVFVSYSSKDKEVVLPIAERLRDAGLKVWFDAWMLRPGDVILAKIEEGLEQSRVLVLCMSANAFGSDWTRLESGTFRFRDPLNKDRRFIPLRLDHAPARGSLGQFLYIDWQKPEAREQLLEACGMRRAEGRSEPENALDLQCKILSLGHTGEIYSVAFSPDGLRALSGSEDNTLRLWDVETGACLRVFEGHSSYIYSVAFQRYGGRVLSGSSDSTIRLWDLETGACLRVLIGHSDRIRSVAFHPDGHRALSGSADQTVRLWDVETGACLRVLEGHSAVVWSVAFHPDGRRALSGSSDNAIRFWDLETGTCLAVLKSRSDSLRAVAFHPAGLRLLSGSDDKTIRLWDLRTGACVSVLEGHSGSVLSVALDREGRRALSGSRDKTIRLWDIETGACLRTLKGHSDRAWSVAFHPDGRRALSGSADRTVRLWDVRTGACLRVFEGHSARVNWASFHPPTRRALSGSEHTAVRLWDVDTGRCVRVLEGHSESVWGGVFHPDGRRALSGSWDKTMRFWSLETGVCLGVLEGHTGRIWGVAISTDGRRALSGSQDHTVRVWDLETRGCILVLEGHAARALAVAFSHDGRQAISGADDQTARLWDLENGDCLVVLKGHTDSVWSVAFHPDGRRAFSGSADTTIRLWDLQTGTCLRVFEGHSESVLSVAFHPDGHHAISGSADATVRLWDLETGACLQVLDGHSDSVRSVAWGSGGEILSAALNGVMRLWNLADSGAPQLRYTNYTNAKVLLVGESGAGKTGLSTRLALNRWERSDSTVGAWATQWKLPAPVGADVEREIWLWDFGGQADQRLIHQLYMEDTALAVLVFDGQKEDMFETLRQWDRDLMRASRKPFTKLLAAGRVDGGGLRVSRNHIDTFVQEHGFAGYFETSAKHDIGCRELMEAIQGGIGWEKIPWRSSPVLFKRLKEEIIQLKDEGRVLMRFNELRDALTLRLAAEEVEFKDEELHAVVGLLAGPGAVWELEFGNLVLLQPERINAYAQAVIQTLRADPHERGCLLEERVLNGELIYQSSIPRLERQDEQFVLLAMHQALVERGLCFREHTQQGTLLSFPSYYRRERPELTGYPAVLVTYEFEGFLDDIYATLVVRLHHTKPFQQDHLWRYAADFKTDPGGKQLGVKLTRRAEGSGRLDVFFDPTISEPEQILFSRFVHEHLSQKGKKVERQRHYACRQCGTPVENRKVAMKKLEDWLSQRGAKPTILCVNCEQRVALWDDLEECFASDETKRRVRELQDQAALVLDNESKERALIGEIISTVALAAQIAREFNVSDHGIDMEIEFKNDAGEATGKKLYLQAKCGDSYLRTTKRDNSEVFKIKDSGHVKYWMDQAFPVFLVIRTSDGEVRWMEIRDWLKQATENGQKPIKQIPFSGESFDVMSVRRWRDRILNPQTPN